MNFHQRNLSLEILNYLAAIHSAASACLDGISSQGTHNRAPDDWADDVTAANQGPSRREWVRVVVGRAGVESDGLDIRKH